MEKQIITGNELATGYGFANEQAHQEVPGLTIRQHFAAMALQGYCANNNTPHRDADSISVYAVELADALIAELNK